MELSVSGARKIMQQYSKGLKDDETGLSPPVAQIVRLAFVSNHIPNVFQQFRYSAGYQGGLVSH